MGKAIIKLGDEIKKGHILCIIEILNISYEIISDMDGRIVEIFVQNGCIIEYGQKLFEIKSTNHH